MTVEELIKQLQQYEPENDVIVYDHRMNAHHADSEGTIQGIYTDFDVETIELGTGNDLTTNICLSFTNDWDYDEEYNKID